MTYAQIARAAGAPRAARAAGNALNKNIFADVPCHRVVRGNGTVGGYAGGSARKINMLVNEGIEIKKGRIELADFDYQSSAVIPAKAGIQRNQT